MDTDFRNKGTGKGGGFPDKGKPTDAMKRFAAIQGGGEPEEFFWEEVDGTDVANMVNVVTKAGYGILLGRTRDGGALVVNIMRDGEKATIFINGKQEAKYKMAAIVTAATS